MSAWWGEIEIAPDTGLHFVVGPLDLWVVRHPRDWRIVACRGADRQEAHVSLAPEALTVPEDAQEIRVAVRETLSPLRVMPALADRPIVARPTTPIYLPTEESVDFYLSTPLWLRLGDARSARHFHELPTQRLSDTWFGRTTTDGELCYASKKSAEERRADLQTHPARAITKTTITNLGDSTLLLERVALPLPSMALFVDDEGTFWTQSLSVAGTHEGLRRIDIAAGPPDEARGARRIVAPRLEASLSISRAFDAVFG